MTYMFTICDIKSPNIAYLLTL